MAAQIAPGFHATISLAVYLRSRSTEGLFVLNDYIEVLTSKQQRHYQKQVYFLNLCSSNILAKSWGLDFQLLLTRVLQVCRFDSFFNLNSIRIFKLHRVENKQHFQCNYVSAVLNLTSLCLIRDVIWKENDVTMLEVTISLIICCNFEVICK